MVGKLAISIIFSPNEMNSGNTSSIVEFMNVFEKKGLIIGFEIQNP
jgi:hypothetical protein